MSYLLDALKKAERERNAQQTPLTDKSESQYLDQKGSLGWLVFAVFGLGVMLATLSFVFFSGDAELEELSTLTENAPLVEIPAEAQRVIPAEQNMSDAPQNNYENVLLDLADLSPAQLQKVPTLRFQSYFYSQDAKYRSVGINDQVYKEGALIAPSVVLKSITVEGVVLRVADFNLLLPKGMDWIRPGDDQ
jgi:hypothetical protein